MTRPAPVRVDLSGRAPRLPRRRHDPRRGAGAGPRPRRPALEAVAPIRVAVIGCGNHSRGALQPNLARLPHFDYVAACDLDAVAAADCARRFGARRRSRTTGVMLDEVRPEAVLVCGPPAAAPRGGSRGRSRGIHLFVEKPSAPDLEGAAALAGPFREAQVVGMVGLFWRHTEAFHEPRRPRRRPGVRRRRCCSTGCTCRPARGSRCGAPHPLRTRSSPTRRSTPSMPCAS